MSETYLRTLFPPELVYHILSFNNHYDLDYKRVIHNLKYVRVLNNFRGICDGCCGIIDDIYVTQSRNILKIIECFKEEDLFSPDEILKLFSYVKKIGSRNAISFLLDEIDE